MRRASPIQWQTTESAVIRPVAVAAAMAPIPRSPSVQVAASAVRILRPLAVCSALAPAQQAMRQRRG